MGLAPKQKWLSRAVRIVALRKGKKGRQPSLTDTLLADSMEYAFRGPKRQRALAQVRANVG